MGNTYMARHGQNEDNANFILNGHRDLPLTELGRKQACQLAEGIREAKIKIDVVYTSPLVRASETAEIVCFILGLPRPVVEKDLIERHFGIMTGRPIHDIEKLVPHEHILKTDTITYFLEAPEAENYPEAYARAQRLLGKIDHLHEKESVLLVGHSDIGKLLYAARYDIPWIEILSKFHFGNSELLDLSAGSHPEESHVVHIAQHNH